MSDERTILTTVLERAGVTTLLDESRGFPLASFSWGPPELAGEPTPFEVDAPPGWVRIATTLDAPDLAIEPRYALGLLYAQTGFGHVHYDAAGGRLRIGASLQAVDVAPPCACSRVCARTTARRSSARS